MKKLLLIILIFINTQVFSEDIPIEISVGTGAEAWIENPSIEAFNSDEYSMFMSVEYQISNISVRFGFSSENSNADVNEFVELVPYYEYKYFRIGSGVGFYSEPPFYDNGSFRLIIFNEWLTKIKGIGFKLGIKYIKNNEDRFYIYIGAY